MLAYLKSKDSSKIPQFKHFFLETNKKPEIFIII